MGRGSMLGGSLSRLANFNDAVKEIVSDGYTEDDGGDGSGEDRTSFFDVAKDSVVHDLKMTRAEVRKLLLWVKEVEVAIEQRPSAPEHDPDVDDEEEDELDKSLPAPSQSPDSAARGSVVAYGGIAMDIISTVDHFPKANSTVEAASFRTVPGGKGANEAVACGNLGTKCYLMGRVGNDDFGHTLLEELDQFVDTKGIAVVPDEGTGFAMIVTALDTRQKTNTICKGANETISADDYSRVKSLLHRHKRVRSMLLTLDAGDRDHVAIGKMAEIGREAGKLVILRASPLSETGGICTELLNNVHILIVTTLEAAIVLKSLQKCTRRMSSESISTATAVSPLQTLQECAAGAQQILNASSHLVAVIISGGVGVTARVDLERMTQLTNPILPLDDTDKYGMETANGCEFSITMPPFRGEVVDVVGALDALTGAIAATLARGVPLSHAMVWGIAGSMWCIKYTGAQESMASSEQLEAFFEESNVHVMKTFDQAGREMWPTCKPLIGDTLRQLEEHLHLGEHVAFGDKLKALRMTAVASGGMPQLRTLLSQPVDFQGQTLLHLAVLYADLPSVTALLVAGADPCASDKYGQNPLERCAKEHKAARRGTRSKLLWIKFCLVCVDQVQWFITHATDKIIEHTANGTLESLQALYDCGKALSEAVSTGWAHTLLTLMTLPFLYEAFDSENKADILELANFLILEVICNRDVCDVAIASFQVTALSLSETTFAHGLAYCASENTINALRGGDAHEEEASDARRRYLEDCFQNGKDLDYLKRTLLHYAMLGENLTMCTSLLNWGHDAFVKDDMDKHPRAYIQTPFFLQQIKSLQRETDAFVSLGHSESVDPIASILVEEAKKQSLDFWWDNGCKAAGPGIREGEPWQNEIDMAMRNSKVCVVILTKKWAGSRFCISEAKCALQYNKPIIALMPPVPESERGILDDVSDDCGVYSALTKRQVFDFSEATPEDFIAGLPRVFEAIESASADNSEERGSFSDSLDRISDVMMPSSGSLRWSRDRFAFIISGVYAEKSEDSQFSRDLANELEKRGIPVCLGFRPSISVKATEYVPILQSRMENCAVLIVTLQNESNFDYLNDLLSTVSESTAGKVVVVPYTRLRQTHSGFGYTSHFTSPTTCCFTDWSGSGLGLTSTSPIFAEGVQDLVAKLDALEGNGSGATAVPVASAAEGVPANAARAAAAPAP